MGTLAGAALSLLIAGHTAALILYAHRGTTAELRGRVKAVLAMMTILAGGVSVALRSGDEGFLVLGGVLTTFGVLYLRGPRSVLVCAGGGYLLSGATTMARLSGDWDAGRGVAALSVGVLVGVVSVFSAALMVRNKVMVVARELLRRAGDRYMLEAVLASGTLALCYLLFNTTRPAYVSIGAVLLIGVTFSLFGEVARIERLSVVRVVALLVATMCLGVAPTTNAAGEGSLASVAPAAVVAPQTTAAPTSNEEKLALCAAIPSSRYLQQRDCYSAYFIERGGVVGTDKAIEELIAVHKSPTEGPQFRPHCHEVLHDFAKDRASQEPIDVLLGSYVITCTGGFAHGILVAYTKEVGWKSIAATLPTFCTTLTEKVLVAMEKKGRQKPTETGWLKWNCDHMLGHLVYENTRDDLNAGAQLCTSWGEDTSERDSCGAGFFMEHFLDLTRNQNGWTAPKQDSDVFKSCNSITGPIKEWCYSESGVSASMFSSYDYPRAAGLCNSFVPDEYQMVCYGSIGRILVVTNGYSPEKSIAACISLSVVEPRAQDSCLEEVAGSMLSETFAPDAAKQACDAVLDAKNKAVCNERRIALENQIAGSGLGGGTGRVES